MEIPNLSQPTLPVTNSPSQSKTPVLVFVIIIALGLTTGFWVSRFTSSGEVTGGASLTGVSNGEKSVSTENISSAQDLKAGIVYGNQAKNFTDRATGTIEKGSINGEGTHILIREGGLSQRASLTSSVVDLDLFVGKNVEVSGETNASTKTSWLMDVGTVKIIE